jgi:peptidoglycan/xylan/chitin deacetylase (PgdA/CDA1 family)
MKQTPLYDWPGKARVAVMVTVMFESWPDGKGPPYGPMASALRDGIPDLQSASWAHYGGRTGIWRLLRLFDEFRLRATICANAKALERFPDAASALAGAGHEIAGHSYTQDMFLPYLSVDEERALIGRCAAIIESMCGKKPVGWASPRMTPTTHTAGILAEHGFLWHGDYHDSDLPYVVQTPAGEIVALPHSDFTDNRVLRASPRDYLDVYRDTFNYLYRDEPGALLNLTVHAHFGARPPMAAVLHQILGHIRGHSEVWLATHEEVARHVASQQTARPAAGN